uniref:NFACT RNA-binding domain-containing protein n=1 Tax=Pseudo-nitzschia australis TaxID=44445 RepID=A0A7S4ENT2_9STRA
MVFYYTIRGGRCKNSHSDVTLTSEDITCYVGRDKHENEHLIEYGWPGDIWFHVEGLSSAHVYFRLDCFGTGTTTTTNSTTSSTTTNSTTSSTTTRSTRSAAIANRLLGKLPIDDLPDDSIEDMCQIVKHNSIKGCKQASCRIVYTPHSNLKKTFGMEAGSVTYHDPKLQRFRRCDKDRARIKQLEQSKSADLTTIDYYAAMKRNERGIIEWKRALRKSGGGNHHSSSNSMQLYDPMLDDLKSAKAKANRQGDDASGLDSGLAALEGLGLDTGSGIGIGPVETAANGNKQGRGRGTNRSSNTTNSSDDDDEHLPIWQREANARLDEHTEESVRFLLARGYTLPEIRAQQARGRDGEPPSFLLSRLWKSRGTGDDDDDGIGQARNGEECAPALWSRICRSRNEEKEVLEAIYGGDDLARFAWRRDGGDDSDSDDDDSCLDGTGNDAFDCVLPVPGYEPPERYERPPPLLLELYVDDGVSYYPYGRPNQRNGNAVGTHTDPVEPPVVALVGGGLPQRYLRRVTDRLVRGAHELCRDDDDDGGGQPRLFDLLQLAGDLATEVLEQETVDLAEAARRRRVRMAKRDRERAREERERSSSSSSNPPTSTAPSTSTSTSTAPSFGSGSDRRAYARSVVAGGIGGTGTGADDHRRKTNYDAGADNTSLVHDLFR